MSHTFRKLIQGARITSTGSYDDGEWVEGASSVIQEVVGTDGFTGSIQPLRPDEMQILPEGRREFQAYKIYTDFQLQISDKGAGTNADKVTIDGEEFEVISVAPNQSEVISHYKAIVVKA